MAIRRVVCFLALSGLCWPQGTAGRAATEPRAPKPGQVIASIMQIPPGSHDRFDFRPVPGGGIRAEGAPILNLICIAYHLQPYQVRGIPGWAVRPRYNINAELAGPNAGRPASGAATFAASALTLRTILAARFRLRFHRAERAGSIYELVARGGAPKLRKARGYEVRSADARLGPVATFRPGLLTGSAITTGTIAAVLSAYLRTRVIDRTNLRGRYDVDLKWRPLAASAPANPRSPPASPADAPGLRGALRQQLGLELRKAKGPVPVLVVDSIRPPSPN